ncbi:MAG: Spy/CpxP family protein refolding chaperone [Deltaproteobacteria bacterium]|nr:Spy/CpxP family protein refolding chaperone [Deltaproteobacteria bacterium]
MKKVVMFLAAIALAAIMVSPASAYRGAAGGNGPGSGYAGDITAWQGLNLTADQTAKIRSLQEAQLKEIQPLQNKLYSKRGELRLLWLQQAPDRDKITAADQEVRALRDQIQDKMTNHRLTVFNVLTLEQQTKVQAYGAGRGNGPRMSMNQGSMGMGQAGISRGRGHSYGGWGMR